MIRYKVSFEIDGVKHHTMGVSSFPTPQDLTADYNNKYGHPDAVITQRLSNAGIGYYSTKTGDIIAQTVDAKHFRVSNYISNNEEKGSEKVYSTKTWYISDVEAM